MLLPRLSSRCSVSFRHTHRAASCQTVRASWLTSFRAHTEGRRLPSDERSRCNAALQTQTQPKCSTSSLSCTYTPTVHFPSPYFLHFLTLLPVYLYRKDERALPGNLHSFIHSFILWSVLRQVRSLFQNEFSTGCDLVHPLSIYSIFSFP